MIIDLFKIICEISLVFKNQRQITPNFKNHSLIKKIVHIIPSQPLNLILSISEENYIVSSLSYSVLHNKFFKNFQTLLKCSKQLFEHRNFPIIKIDWFINNQIDSRLGICTVSARIIQ